MSQKEYDAQSGTVSREQVHRKWSELISLHKAGGDERGVASQMVGCATDPDKDLDEDPAFQLIFELAARLELPADMTNRRDDCWKCIEALMPVLLAGKSEGSS